MGLKPEEVELLVSVFEHNCDHARHVENERLWYTNIYVLTVAGILAFVIKPEVDFFLKIICLFFLLVISMLGFFMSFRLKADFDDFLSKMRETIKLAEIKIQNKDLSQLVGIGAETGWTTKVKLRWIFVFFYVFMMVFMSMLIIFYSWTMLVN